MLRLNNEQYIISVSSSGPNIMLSCVTPVRYLNLKVSPPAGRTLRPLLMQVLVVVVVVAAVVAADRLKPVGPPSVLGAVCRIGTGRADELDNNKTRAVGARAGPARAQLLWLASFCWQAPSWHGSRARSCTVEPSGPLGAGSVSDRSQYYCGVWPQLIIRMNSPANVCPTHKRAGELGG